MQAAPCRCRRPHVQRFQVTYRSITMSKVHRLLGALCLMTLGACATNPNEPPKAAQGVYFVSPADGATVSSPFKVVFGLKGMEIKPAGAVVAGTGHHHLIINADPPAQGNVIPADPTHLHFGKGQTEAEVKLDPGTYRLTMQFADGYHASYGKEMSASIKVTVK
jgi:hypothetical protein